MLVAPPGLFPYRNGTPFASCSPPAGGSADILKGLLVLLEATASRGRSLIRDAHSCPPTRNLSFDSEFCRRKILV